LKDALDLAVIYAKPEKEVLELTKGVKLKRKRPVVKFAV
jgi:hypothetical protein